jgi:hypothetical protein
MSSASTLCACLAIVAAAAGAKGSTAALNDVTLNPNNTLAAAPSFCQPSTQTASPSQDSWIDERAPAQNHGSEVLLDVTARRNRNRRTLIEFALPPEPPFCSVTSAQLQLYATAAATGRTIEVRAAAAAWQRQTVTWQNQPPATGSVARAPSGPGWISWDVTPQVEAMYGTNNYGFVLHDAAEGATPGRSQVYRSSRGVPQAETPKLEISYR